MARKIRWGIVSAGNIANTFASDIHYVDNSEVAAVAARDLNRAEMFAKQHGIAKAYQGYESLLNDPEVDAIYVATPHSLHFENTRDALLAGKPVLCEKPFTLGEEQALALFELAKNSNLFVMEAMWSYFLPAIKQAQAWVSEGKIGEIKQIQADFGYPKCYDPSARIWNPKLGGGCMLDMGIYPIALNWMFNKQRPIDIKSVVMRVENGLDSHVATVLTYQNSVSLLTTSFLAKLRNWAYIIGSEGYIALPDFWRASEALLYQSDDCIAHFKDERLGSGFEFQIEAANHAIRQGKLEVDQLPHSDTLAFQRHMAEILNAAES